MVEMRMGEQNFVDDMNAVRVLEIQQRRHDAHAAVDERVPDDLAVRRWTNEYETLACR